MNRFNFTTFLTSNLDLDQTMIDLLLEKCTLKKVEKGEFLLREGEMCNHSFFVEKGLLRQYSIGNDGKEHIIQFAPENWFVVDRDSVFFRQPSVYFIQAIEPSEVLLIEESFFKKLGTEQEHFVAFNNQLLHNHIRSLQKRINMLLGASAEERYLDFVETYPDILLRVSQVMVASYLGITPESLSRVRKALAERNRR